MRFKILRKDTKFSIDLFNACRMLRGEDFEYSGGVPQDLEQQIENLRSAISGGISEDVAEDMFLRTVPSECRAAVKEITASEDFLDSLVDRINKKQLKENA